jgi:hypothetical protein
MLGLLLLCGCLEFAQQTLTYRYDTATDTLKIYQSYQGIYGQSATNRLVDEERSQLQSVLEGQRTFFFANWIFEFNREQTKVWLEELKNPPPEDDPKPDAEMIAHLETLLKLALENVTVENGPFYHGADGKLCGVQQVTVKQWSKILAAGNVSLRDAYKREAAKADTAAADRELYLKSASSPQQYVRMEGNQLQVRLPLTPAEYEKSFKDDPDSARQFELLNQAGGKFTYANNEITMVVGTPTARTVRLTMPVYTNAYSTNVVTELQKQKRTILPKFDADAAAEQFLK